MIIRGVKAKKILDSRKKPTIEVSVNGQRASSPSGKSTSSSATPLYRKSLQWNINFLNKFKPSTEINEFSDLEKLERELKTKLKLKNVKQFGANALLALESAVLKALAKSQKKQLWQVINPKAKKFPVPAGNAIGGGLHSEFFKDHPVFQEFLIFGMSKYPSKNIKDMNSAYKKLGRKINSKKKNDEGAWQTSLNNEQILEVLSGFKNIRFGLDVAATSFYKNGNYIYKKKKIDKNSQILYIDSLIRKYDLLYVEDPLHEKDFNGFSKIDKKNLIVGDDLTATQISLLNKAIKKDSINAMIVKPNQNGSLIEVAKIMDICKENKIKTIISHRSGETLDNALADFAFGFQADIHYFCDFN
jgi:enolase